MDFLNRFLCVLLHILRHTILHALLQLLDALTTCVANRNLGSFRFLRALLGKFLTAFLRQGRDTQTNHLTVILWHDTYRRIDDGLFNDLEHRLVPRLDGDAAWVGHHYGCHARQRNHRTVAIYTDSVEDVHVGFSCTDATETFFQMHGCHLHVFLSCIQ